MLRLVANNCRKQLYFAFANPSRICSVAKSIANERHTIQAGRERNKQIDKQSYGETNIQTDRQTYTQTDRRTDKDRQTDKQADKQEVRQSGPETGTHHNRADT